MEIKTYKCDKCKATVPKQKDLINIEIIAKPEKYASYGKKYFSIDVCTTCAEKVGVIKRVIKKDEIVNEVQDVKEKLYNVVVQLIQETGIQVEY